MRTEPNTSSNIIRQIEAGQSVKALNHRSGWFSVSYQNRTGWVYGAFISEDPPPSRARRAKVRPVTPPAVARIAPIRRSGQPIRSPYVGRCDCPYDLMRNGRLCGGRSAYSRPGGRDPTCYY
ncbi:SH3 domain-containing protein [Mesorhizobium sp. RMAD-H1]|uniref:SH3 domain-containing protein n=1 Tax=Mesorhizobium sp. RMAD-H1 TaxID=2587065 RepID=UPI00160F0E76|nr:SH3 domain-containing protein [Mesorhizobium sp. RMAD-H1]